MLEILIALNIAALTVVVVSLCLSYRKFHKVMTKQPETPTEIVGQRSRLEAMVYELQDSLVTIDGNEQDKNMFLIEYKDEGLNYSLKTPNDSFFANLGISLDNVKVKAKTAFCLIPFHKKFKNIYTAIEQGCQDAGFVCCKSDTPTQPGNLLRQIIELLLQSEIIIAVLDGRNPNVFYELGLAHSLGKPVLLVVNNQNKDEVPFDIRSDRLILYPNPPELTKRLAYTLTHLHRSDT